MSLITKLADFKAFIRSAWALAVPYFQSEEKWKARALLAAIIALNLGFVYTLVLFNEWNRFFYDALQEKNYPVFLEQLLRYTILAFIYIVIAVYRFYLTQQLEMRWRAWMTRHYLQRWLDNQVYYHLELTRYAALAADQSPDNPDQRIQEDLKLFTTSTVGLSMGLLNALVTLLSFVSILWSLSGAFSFSFGGTEFDIPGFMLWVAILYCIVGSVITHYVGRPLIPPQPGARARIQRSHRTGPRREGRAETARPALWPCAGQLPATDRRAKAPDHVHGHLQPGLHCVPLHCGGTALLQWCHPARHHDSDRLCLRSCAGRAVLVHRQLRRLGRLARHHRPPDPF